MRKLVLIFLALVCFSSFVGCQKINSKNTELVYESFTEKEEYLLNLTGNKVLMYKLNNIPGDKKYEILLTYEVYEKGEKVKEDIIARIMQDEPRGESENKTIGINLQSDKITWIIGDEGSSASGSYELKEELTQSSQAFFTNNVDMPIGTDACIYYATSSNVISASTPLGVQINSNVIKDIVKDGETTILIKISSKEI